MNPALIVAIPVGLVIIGMILNSLSADFNQPASSPEQDTTKRLEADLLAYRKLYGSFRSRFLARQKNAGRFAWLVIFAVIGSSIWLYTSTVSSTTERNQVVALQTLGTDEGNELVLSLTTSDGGNVKYLVKLPTAEAASAAGAKEPARVEKVSKWETEKLGTLVSSGATPLTIGVVLKKSN